MRVAKLNPDSIIDYYLNDHLGSARVLYGSGWSASYYPFGELVFQAGSEGDNHFDFTGHERDRRTGLLYAGARFYNPWLGRWLGVDPLFKKHYEWSPYNYVLNNPLIFVDLDGKQVRTESIVFFEKYKNNLNQPMPDELRTFYIKYFSMILNYGAILIFPESKGMSTLLSAMGVGLNFLTGDPVDKTVSITTTSLGFFTPKKEQAVLYMTLQLLYDMTISETNIEITTRSELKLKGKRNFKISFSNIANVGFNWKLGITRPSPGQLWEEMKKEEEREKRKKREEKS